MSTSELSSAAPPSATSAPETIARFVVEAAVSAPSVLNTQPWWFYGADHEIGMHADDERKLPVADPDGREMLISCGGALLNARVALRYIGIVPIVKILPEPRPTTLVAKITWTETAPPTEHERELFAEIARRRTHQGGFDAEPLPEGLLACLIGEAAKERATLRIMSDEAQRTALAALVAAGDFAIRRDPARAREQQRWSSRPGSSRRDGVPSTAYPARPDKIEPNFPARDFARGRGWGLPPTGEGQPHREAGAVAVLTTDTDRPEDWVRAGQALQRALLLAASCGVTAALHTQPLEVPQLRDFIFEQLSDGAYPQLVLRLGVTSQSAASVRRAVDDVLF